MKEYLEIQKPELGYTYEFETESTFSDVRMLGGARFRDCQRCAAS